MTNEEKYIRNRMGSKNSFKVPEGYFDTFATQFMEQLPAEGAQPMAQRRTPLLVRLRPMLYAAAFALLAVLSVTAYLNYPADQNAEQALALSDAQADAYFDEAADYAMVDNNDIYACLMND